MLRGSARAGASAGARSAGRGAVWSAARGRGAQRHALLAGRQLHDLACAPDARASPVGAMLLRHRARRPRAGHRRRQRALASGAGMRGEAGQRARAQPQACSARQTASACRCKRDHAAHRGVADACGAAARGAPRLQSAAREHRRGSRWSCEREGTAESGSGRRVRVGQAGTVDQCSARGGGRPAHAPNSGRTSASSMSASSHAMNTTPSCRARTPARTPAAGRRRRQPPARAACARAQTGRGPRSTVRRAAGARILRRAAGRGARRGRARPPTAPQSAGPRSGRTMPPCTASPATGLCAGALLEGSALPREQAQCRNGLQRRV